MNFSRSAYALGNEQISGVNAMQYSILRCLIQKLMYSANGSNLFGGCVATLRLFGTDCPNSLKNQFQTRLACVLKDIRQSPNGDPQVLETVCDWVHRPGRQERANPYESNAKRVYEDLFINGKPLVSPG